MKEKTTVCITGKKHTSVQIKERVFSALQQNVNYYEETILGVPASHLDSKVFHQDAPFLQDAPFISTMVHNPNHIGCHTLGVSEHFFNGTQEIEKEVIDICAVDILRGTPGTYDGYVASGGTEANMQAIWIYRNLFIQEYGADLSEICILTSDDAHYSMDKAANILGISLYRIPVHPTTRKIDQAACVEAVDARTRKGKKYFIVVANMMTTMFGSVDDETVYTDLLEERGCPYRLHIDGAFGGFFYPFADTHNTLDFSNPRVSSITLDAHKMAQAPYGTGIFLVRKDYLQYTNTREASYVEGEDYTLIGSRSGANAVAIWMILSRYGPYGWKEKIFILLKRTEWLCQQLEETGVLFYRHPYSNIVSIQTPSIAPETAHAFGLVPDNHHAPSWYKVVIMEHVDIESLIPLIAQLKAVSA